MRISRDGPAPRGLNIKQASAYFGVSLGTFRKMMRLGLVPRPLQMPGMSRLIWDRDALAAAMTRLGGINNPKIGVAAVPEIVL